MKLSKYSLYKLQNDISGTISVNARGVILKNCIWYAPFSPRENIADPVYSQIWIETMRIVYLNHLSRSIFQLQE